MIRHWLTSTTALALVLNAAGPLPGAAYDKAQPRAAASKPAVDMRLAENENNPAAQELMSDVLGDAPTTGSTEQEPDAATAAQVAAEAAAAEEAAQAAAAKAAAEEAARAEAEAQAAAEAKAAEEQAAEAARQAEAEAKATAQAEAEAEAAQQAETEAARQAEAEAQAAAAAEAEAEAAQKAEAEAQAADQAETEAEAATIEAEAEQAAETEATADAQSEAEAPSGAESEAAEAAEQGAAPQSGENDTPDIIGEAPRTESTENDTPDILPEVSAADQATAAEIADESAAAAAAASGEGEVIETQDVTVTEEDARASNEEFDTSASGQNAATAQTVVPNTADDDNDLLQNLGIAAAAGLGAYAIGRMLDGGGRVVSNTGDRVVVEEPSGGYRIIKDDDTLLRRPGSDVQTQTYSDGSTRSAVTAADGSQTVTIRAADGRVLRRTRILPDGRSVVLFDDTKSYARVDVSELERAQANRASDYDYSTSDVDQLRAALDSANGTLPDRTYSLNQIRRIDAVRHLVPVIALDAINFKTGSAVIGSEEAQDLSDLGRAMAAAIDEDPGQVFLIEGHTDTVGDASYNLALSDRRAESVALALTEYFDVPPSNMIVQGYGEQDLRIRQQGDIRANRRGAVRNITPLLGGDR
ncbi:OmpA family protein [Roseovarius sp. S4756]|uniref:OmpA family protein n=1 Tax=Roseovarius maritimus TaxID=3342637 RepID=UPI0037285D71